MSFLNIKRLLPPRKVWKLFTNKLQIIKLNRSRAVHKPKIKTFKKLFLSIHRTKFKLKPRSRNTLIHLNKLTPPVYVDRLFVDSLSTPPPPAAFNNKSSSSYFKRRSSAYLKRGEAVAADDMWESMVLTSPQSEGGINQRADEFIASFRAQMRKQEMLLARAGGDAL